MIEVGSAARTDELPAIAGNACVAPRRLVAILRRGRAIKPLPRHRESKPAQVYRTIRHDDSKALPRRRGGPIPQLDDNSSIHHLDNKTKT